MDALRGSNPFFSRTSRWSESSLNLSRKHSASRAQPDDGRSQQIEDEVDVQGSREIPLENTSTGLEHDDRPPSQIAEIIEDRVAPEKLSPVKCLDNLELNEKPTQHTENMEDGVISEELPPDGHSDSLGPDDGPPLQFTEDNGRDDNL